MLSAPLITTLVDATGLLIYLTMRKSFWSKSEFAFRANHPAFSPALLSGYTPLDSARSHFS